MAMWDGKIQRRIWKFMSLKIGQNPLKIAKNDRRKKTNRIFLSLTNTEERQMFSVITVYWNRDSLEYKE